MKIICTRIIRAAPILHFWQCVVLTIFYLTCLVDKLYTIQPGENESYLPSPEALKEKILVKVSEVNLFPCLEFHSNTIANAETWLAELPYTFSHYCLVFLCYKTTERESNLFFTSMISSSRDGLSIATSVTITRVILWQCMVFLHF